MRVTAEDDKGVTLNGMKMLASGAAYAHEVLIGNVMPLAPDQLKESITCVIPLNLPGLTLLSLQPFNRPGMKAFDHPLTARFDESDCMLVFKDVKVPWEKVIVHDNPGLSRDIYVKTAAHVIATIPNFNILEFSYGEVPWRAELIDPPEQIIDSTLVISKRPGLGIKLNEKTAAKYAVS